jgi:probable rRNA maturation factor
VALDLVVDDDVTVAAELRRRLATEVARMIRAAARHDGRADYDVALRLTGDAAIRALNRDYRAKDKPTDVLAFAQREAPLPRSGNRGRAAVSAHPELLGDVVISVDTARRQARRGLYVELLHLASHGLCHLLGYDHRDDAEERTMNARAAALRSEARRRGRVRAA